MTPSYPWLELPAVAARTPAQAPPPVAARQVRTGYGRRHRQVAAVVEAGSSVADAAREFGIKPRTVALYVALARADRRDGIG